MKALKTTYWVSTGAVAALVLLSAYNYLTREEVKLACQHLGFPDYFRIELAIAKILGASALVLPIHATLKEWAYFGFMLIFISAIIAHLASGDTFSESLGGLGYLVILIVSYITFHKQ